MNAWLFWVCIAALVYVYIGYPVLLLLFSWLRKPIEPGADTPLDGESLPSIAILFSARNEAQSLPAKFTCLEKLDYPPDRLRILAVSDGSTDETAALLEAHPRVEATAFAESVGKNLALNHLVPMVDQDILVFTDANTIIAPGALKACAKWFRNPKVGFVAGHVPYEAMGDEDRVRRGSNVYWQYEARLRSAESRLGSVLVGAGGLLAMARSLWQPMLPDVANDFHLPVLVAAADRALVFEPEFVGTEKAASRLADEFWRSRRIVSRGVRGTIRLFKYFARKPFRLWQLISHKILRWCTLLFLVGALYTSMKMTGRVLYQVGFWMQVAAYVAAIAGGVGHILGRRGKAWWIPHVLFQALALQTAAFLGVLTGILLGAPSIWEKPTSAR